MVVLAVKKSSKAARKLKGERKKAAKRGRQSWFPAYPCLRLLRKSIRKHAAQEYCRIGCRENKENGTVPQVGNRIAGEGVPKSTKFAGDKHRAAQQRKKLVSEGIRKSKLKNIQSGG